MMGREVNLPVDIVFPPPQREPPESYPEYLHQLEERLTAAHESAKRHLFVAHENMCFYKLESRSIPAIDPSRPVYLFNPALKKGVTPKTASFWKGPYPVVEQLTPYLLRLNVGGRRGTQVVHRAHIHQPRI
jgi:hypothetical protein